jgi:hypothetical protein
LTPYRSQQSTSSDQKLKSLLAAPVIQKEAQRTTRFQKYLEAHQREVIRYRIIPVGSATLYSDLADVTDGVLYEAKGSAERMSVRLASARSSTTAVTSKDRGSRYYSRAPRPQT